MGDWNGERHLYGEFQRGIVMVMTEKRFNPGSVLFTIVAALALMCLVPIASLAQQGTTAGGLQVSGAVTNGHCVSFISSTTVQDSGGACGGSGSPCIVTAGSLQYNNAGAFGCVTDFTFSGHTITSGASGVFDIHAGTFLQPTATADPGTCSPGNIYFNTTSSVPKVCTATNTWSTLALAASASGIVNSGTNGHIAYYASTGAAVSSDAALDDSITTANTLTYGGTGGINAAKYGGTGVIQIISICGSLPASPGANLIEVTVDANCNLSGANGTGAYFNYPLLGSSVTVNTLPILSQVAASGTPPLLTNSSISEPTSPSIEVIAKPTVVGGLGLWWSGFDLKGVTAGTYTVGDLACSTGTTSATVANCSSGTNNAFAIGVLQTNNGTDPVYATQGVVIVNSQASSTFTNGDYVCADASNGGVVIDNGTTACSNLQIGFVYITDPVTTTSHNVYLAMGQKSSGGGGGGGSGTVTANNGVVNSVAAYPAAGGSTSVSPSLCPIVDNGTTMTYACSGGLQTPQVGYTGNWILTSGFGAIGATGGASTSRLQFDASGFLNQSANNTTFGQFLEAGTTGNLTSAVLQGAQVCTGGGTANAQTATCTPSNSGAGYKDGMQVCFYPTHPNGGGTVTLAVDGLAVYNIDKNVNGLTAIVANDLLATTLACFHLNLSNTVWVLDIPQTQVAWNQIGAVIGASNLNLANGAVTSSFTSTSPTTDFFSWKNTTAATSGTSQSSPLLSLLGTEWHAAASTSGGVAFQFVPGSGTDAASTFAVTHEGSATGVMTSQFPGPVAAGVAGVAAQIILAGSTNTCATTTNALNICGPGSASFTAYGLQFPTTAPTIGQVPVFKVAASAISPVAYVQHDLPCADTSSSATTYTCSTGISLTAYATGQCFSFYSINQNNSGASTLNVDGIAAKSLVKWQGTALAASDLKANSSQKVCYDGTNLEVSSIGNAPSGGTVPINNVISATGAIATIADGNNPLTINCAQTTASQACATFGETTAATQTTDAELQVSTLTTSGAAALQITQGAAGPSATAAPPIINVAAAAAGGAATASVNGSTGAGYTLPTGAGSAGGATTGNGGAGGSFTITEGAGGAAGGTATNNGGNGGGWSLTTGAGGNGGTGAATAGSGGPVTFTMGAPGTNSATGTAGAVGLFNVTGNAPASTANATGVNAGSLFSVSGVTGGASSNAAGTAGTGSSPSITAGNGGAGTGTNAVGGAGGAFTITAGNGGGSLGTGANANGGNIVLNPGTAGTGGSGTAGKAGIVSVGGANAGLFFYTQGTANTTTNTNIPANSAVYQAPTAVTAQVNTIPGTAAQGLAAGVGSSTGVTQNFTGGAAYHVGPVTIGTGTSIGATSLCSTTNCPVGDYDIAAYVEITTACTTTGSYIVWLGWTDDGSAKNGSSTTTFFPFPLNGSGVPTTVGTIVPAAAGNYAQAHIFLHTTGAANNSLGSINYGTTATACGTGGPMVGKLFLTVTPLS